ncbi:tol-pal system protein YbgF [Ideonella azotifigens]|uniref:Cell division coordinator CpoB n=1 Tax=Ideonella azotifigens TaxID=513160 RepID=A0ABN1JHF9_9BURK|nr:tol-pal system protein YbgF [Ideonella azotifigens]MCD2343616.1 tol-pal system protein YbgF [Ideonella azotifigens]
MTRWLKFLPAALALSGLWLSAVPAHAGVFDDDEARKAILDLRSKQAQTETMLRTRLQELADQVQQLQRGLLDLNSQNEQLRAEMARMRGQEEQMLRDLSEVQRKQKDIQVGVDERMRKFEPQPVSVDGKDFSADPEEKKLYDDAMASLRNGDFDKAAVGLQSLMKRYPSSGYTDSARYWLGNAQYGLRQYKDAIVTFKAFLAGAPEHVRAPEGWLAVANCQAEMKDNKSAKRTLEDLIKQFPKSEAAQAAKERLVSLK